MELVKDENIEEKMFGLRVLLNNYREPNFPIYEKAVPVTKVFKLTVHNMRGKQSPKRV